MTAKSAAERQAKCYAKKKERLAQNGGRVIHWEVYRKTDEIVKECCVIGGYEDENEMLTILMKNIDKLSLAKVKKLLEL